jgi:beta-xylosidase
MSPSIQNPVLPGFFPDPSICRAGGDYFIANSSFEWFPGVPIHHSRDLIHWRLIGHALTRRSQLDLRGVPDSAGVWAPSLSYADGSFWLVYTNLRHTGMGRPFKDLDIFLTTAPDILGPWSDPLELNSVGFDPSLFHDQDGRKWLLNMIWDFRPGRSRFAGIVIQEYDPAARRLVGPMTKILEPQNLLCEGPNLYQHDGWYYLMLAAGGTGWNHGISMARAKSILGPYEPDPQSAVLTSRDDPALPLQKAGHGELVQTPSGQWYLAHLASRPLRTSAPRNAASPDQSASAAAHAGDRCVLGRETCLQEVAWRDGWLRLATGGVTPQLVVPAPQCGVASAPVPGKPLVPPDLPTAHEPSGRSADFPVCGFWGMRGRRSASSPQFPNRNTGQESPVNPQVGKPALREPVPGENSPNDFAHGTHELERGCVQGDRAPAAACSSVPSRCPESFRGSATQPRSDCRVHGESRVPSDLPTPHEPVPTRISDFGLLSDFDIRVSDLSQVHGEGRGEGERGPSPVGECERGPSHALGVPDQPAAPPAQDHFAAPRLEVYWCTLRVPADESWLSLDERPGWLRLRGRDSLHSCFDQSLVARRVQHFHFTAETCLEFSPDNFMQSAGLICYYDTRTHFYLRVTRHESRGKILGLACTDDGAYDEPAGHEINVNDWQRFFLRAEVAGQQFQFSASPDQHAWQPVGPVLDASKLSDDYGAGLHFTGAMVGLCAQDLGGSRQPADFDYFDYRTP